MPQESALKVKHREMYIYKDINFIVNMSTFRHLDMSISRHKNKKCTDVDILCLYLDIKDWENKTLNNKLERTNYIWCNYSIYISMAMYRFRK